MRWEIGQKFVDKVRFSIINEQKYREFRKRIRIAFGKEDAINPLNISAIHSKYGKIYYPLYTLYDTERKGGGGGFEYLQRIWRKIRSIFYP